VATKKTPHQRLGGTRHGKTTRRSKASQARLDAILGAIGDDTQALSKLLSAILEIDPAIILINH
jgi:hypothetical protein